MTLSTVTPSISPNDPQLNTPITLADMKALGGLIFDPATERWIVRPDLDVPLEPDQDAMIRNLLARDTPTDEHNKFRSKANALVACRKLVRHADCEHGDETRSYCVFCGQKTLCRYCGTGASLAKQLKLANPDLYALVNSSEHQVQTFELGLGGPCIGLTAAGGPCKTGTPEYSEFASVEYVARIKLGKYLYRKLKAALDRQSAAPYGAKFFPNLDPASRGISFKVLWLDMPCTLHKIRSMWETVCRRHWTKIVSMILFAAPMSGLPCGPVSTVSNRQYDQGSASKSLQFLFDGIERLLMLTPSVRLPYALNLKGAQLGITTGLLRGQALEDASEGLVWDEFDEDEAPHGVCSTHGTPLRMSMEAPIPPSELQRRFPRVWIGPIGGYRVKPLHSQYQTMCNVHTEHSAPPW